MLEQLNTYDWEEAFAFAGGGGCGSPNVQSVSLGCSVANFSREDVATIYGMIAGENDGEPWRIYGQLKDARYFYIEAGCDYTGWDCQAGGTAWVSSTRDGIIREGLTEESRRLFGLVNDNVGNIPVKGINRFDEDGNDNQAGFVKITKDKKLKIPKVKNALYGMVEALKEAMREE